MTQPATDEVKFLRDLVKSSRQRTVHVKWVDRDGTERLTVLSQSESSLLNAIALERRLSKSEVLRQAAFVPVQPAPPDISRNT